MLIAQTDYADKPYEDFHISGTAADTDRRFSYLKDFIPFTTKNLPFTT